MQGGQALVAARSGGATLQGVLRQAWAARGGALEQLFFS